VLINIKGKEYWMGLENIYRITNERNYSLRIKIKRFGESKNLTATYKTFRLTENVSTVVFTIINILNSEELKDFKLILQKISKLN